MRFSFTAVIYKVGINPCVTVPPQIIKQLREKPGYIYIRGTIGEHPFVQTLVPLADGQYRLYVNGPMLKGAHLKNGDQAKFSIEKNPYPERRTPPMLPALRKTLASEKLGSVFNALTPSRRKEILKYMASLKSREAIDRNIVKVIDQLKQG